MVTTTRTPDDRLPSFAVVVPAFNEEGGIEASVLAIDQALAELPNDTILIVVDDGSVDGTVRKLEELAERMPKLVVIFREANGGYGAALRTGTVAAASSARDYVLFMDSDLTNDPAYISVFAEHMSEGADVIKATRYAGGGGVHGVPMRRRLPSLAGNLLARKLFGLPLSDCTNGFRAVRTDLLSSVELGEPAFAVIMEELYRLRPIARTYAEVPNVLTTRAVHLRPTAFDYG